MTEHFLRSLFNDEETKMRHEKGTTKDRRTIEAKRETRKIIISKRNTFSQIAVISNEMSALHCIDKPIA